MLKEFLKRFFSTKNGGIMSLVTDENGKFSFRRSIPVLVLTAIVIPDFNVNGITLQNGALTLLACLVYLLPEIVRNITRKKE